MSLISTLKETIDPQALIENFGYVGIFLIVFAESGLLLGFFLPGDSLLLVAGALAAVGVLRLWVLLPLIFVAAFLGDQVGYTIGARYGRRLFQRRDSWLFHHRHVERAEQFFARHGNRTIVLARFVPIIRTFAPMLAGIGRMPYRQFVTYNFLGAALWGLGVTLAGYGLGHVPQLAANINFVVAVIIVLSLLPVISHLRRR